jgi:DNA/RNA endonuclease G (NUC1)
MDFFPVQRTWRGCMFPFLRPALPLCTRDPVLFSNRPAASPRSWAAAALVVLAAGCTDHPTTSVPAPESAAQSGQFICTVTVKSGQMHCSEPGVPSGILATLYGGQNQLVRLASTNADSAGGIFSIDVTVTNLLANQAIGTLDGTTPHPDGVRVFFVEGPTRTGGSGTVELDSVDGTGIFTSADQPYMQYDEVLAPQQMSAPRKWRFRITPGVETFHFAVLISTEAQARLVISEMMANPGGAIQDSVGEYVEVYNAGVFPVNLRGFYVRDNGSAVDTIKTDLIVNEDSYVVLARSTDPAKNGGVPADYAYTGRIGTTSTNLTFSNSGADRFVIRSPAGVLVDSVSYTSSGTVAKSGIARELSSLSTDNTLVDGANWADATNVYDATNNNRGTPGTGPLGGGTPAPLGPPVTVSVSPSSATLAVGTVRQYTATARDSTNQLSPTSFTWASTDSSVATVTAAGVVTTVANGTAVIQATSANGIVGSATLTVFTPSTGAVYRNHVEFGTPADGDASDDILLSKTTFSVSYNSARGGPNWVSWNLNATHFGDAERCDCFMADATLPAGSQMIVTSDYTGSGYSRGHMVMSEQRTQTDAENASTFLMTNILPQYQDMNGGPWLRFEIYNNDLARIDGKEVYNIAGGLYSASPATLKGEGKVAIPTHTWKIIVVMNSGQGLANVGSASDIQVIAVSMPNATGIQANDWPMYRVSVDALEAATGYDFLALLPDAIEAAVEAAN